MGPKLQGVQLDGRGREDESGPHPEGRNCNQSLGKYLPPLPPGLLLIWFWSRGSPPVSCLISLSPPPILSPTRFEQTLGLPPALLPMGEPPSPEGPYSSFTNSDDDEPETSGSERGGGEDAHRPLPLRQQLVGACRADDRLRPLLTLNVSCSAAENRFISHLSQVTFPTPCARQAPSIASLLTSSVGRCSTSRSRRWACWQGVSAFPSSLCASARSTATAPSSAQQPSGSHPQI